MIRTVTLSASSFSLQGGYSAGDDVLVLCDCSRGSFEVTLPDANSARDVKFYCKKIDSTAEIVTIKGVANQPIDDIYSVQLTSQNQTETLIPSFQQYYRFRSV